MFFIGVLILLSDGLPILYRASRVGQGGRIFHLYKFRSMSRHSEEKGGCLTLKNDSRITGIGRILRSSKLDELPQLINVLKGEMSLIGPRPHRPHEVNLYEEWHKDRLLVKQGLTGLWQIKAQRIWPIHKNIRYDLYYLRKASLVLDIRILAATVPFILKAKSNHYNEENCIHTYNLPLSK